MSIIAYILRLLFLLLSDGLWLLRHVSLERVVAECARVRGDTTNEIFRRGQPNIHNTQHTIFYTHSASYNVILFSIFILCCALYLISTPLPIVEGKKARRPLCFFFALEQLTNRAVWARGPGESLENGCTGRMWAQNIMYLGGTALRYYCR
jgi:hypothetical protein